MPATAILNSGQRLELRCLGRYTQMRDLPMVNFRDAVEAVKYVQALDWNPEDPYTPFGRGLIRMVCSLLDAMKKVSGSNREYRLRLYVAVDTPLDNHHGTDAVLALEDVELGHEVVMTIDLTRNPAKVMGKARVVLGFGEIEAIERAAEQLPELVQPTELVKEITSTLWVYWYNFVAISGGNYDLKTQPPNGS